MSLPEQKNLRHDVLEAEKKLWQTERMHGKDSDEYRTALRHFSRIWSVLRMTHARDEFLAEV